MSEYIKREDAVKAIARYLSPVFERAEEGATRVLSDIPCADVVEVVRCKDCIHRIDYPDGDGWYCDVTNNCLMRDENFYCSYGERKTKDE